MRSLRDLYDSTDEVHLVCLLADAKNISFKEAVRDTKWQTADEEIKAIHRNNTWKVTMANCRARHEVANCHR